MTSRNPGETPKAVRRIRRPATMRMRRGGSGGAGVLRALASVILALGILSIAGCKGGSGSSGSTNIKSVAITPTTVNVPINGNAEFTATVTLSNSTLSTTTSVTWEVNGAAGGNASTIGSITPSSVDQNVGIYKAPPTVPNSGAVNITAVVQQTNTSSTTPPTVTSNTATVTVGAGLGLSITPTSATVAAGGSKQFGAFLNGLPDSAATWNVTSASGITDSSVIGSVTSTGVYTAPASPPPGGTVTVTATDGASNVSATVNVVYSDLSLSGPYAFSYTGNDASGFLAAAGSFVADGKGHITNGVEDFNSFLTGLNKGVAISGTYSVGSDGRGTATITRGSAKEVWTFALTTGQHAMLTLAEPNATGGGTIDQQSVNALSNSASVIAGPYVFSALGANGRSAVAPSTPFTPRGMAGEFTADGAGGFTAGQGTLIDVNDNGSPSPDDTTLTVSYAFDAANPGSGRGTITLQSNSLGATPRQFAFYAVGTAVDQTTGNSYVTQLHLVEIDGIDSMAGDMYSGPSATALGNGYLSAGNYVLTYGGSSPNGAYAAGGVVTADGSGGASGGVLDTNDAGATALNTTISGCTASNLDPTKRRIDVVCTAGSSTPEFAMYQTSLGSAVMLELDPAAVATGMAYEQCGPASAGCAAAAPAVSANSIALGLIGQGIFYNSPSSYQQDIDGQISLGAGGTTPGSIDIANYPNAPFTGDPIAAVTLGTASLLGRGTTVVTASNPAATYNLIYYLIDDKTALVLDSDKTFVLRGSFGQQF
jgi:hypothetical protein